MTAALESQRPWIHVHTLGEFVYCPRAGIVAFKHQGADIAEDCDRIPNLGYTPGFDYATMLEQKAKVARQLKLLVPFLLVAAIALVATFWVLPYVTVALFVACIVTGAGVWRYGKEFVAIMAKLEQYQAATPSPIDFSQNEAQPVHWWGLVKAGFQPSLRKEPWRDEFLHLAGRPWRVVSDGHRHIPVIGHRSTTASQLAVQPSHVARLAAYAYLQHLCERADVRWGIVIDLDSLQGMAVPISAARREETARFVNDLLKTIRAKDVTPPSHDLCRRCPLGFPELVTAFDPQPSPYPSPDRDGQMRHSRCGDEFKWQPPHEFWQQQV